MSPPKRTEKGCFAHLFIDRPVLAWVLNIILIVLGCVAYSYLSVRQYPQVEFPLMTVMTQYEGASPDVMEMQITRPLEEAFAGLEGLDLITSQSMAEQSKIFLRFKESRSLDAAAADVRDKLSRLDSGILPREATTPRITKANIDSGAVMSLALTSNRHNLADLYDYTTRSLKSDVESVSGVAAVEIYGGTAYEMHIILDPQKMASVGTSVSEVAEALKQQNFSKPAGRIGSKDQEFLIITRAQVSKPEDFENLVLFEKDDYVVRISDVGYVKLNKDDKRFRIRYNGQDAILLDITAQSRSNPIQISADVQEKLTFMRENLPSGMRLEVAFDDSTFINKSIAHVYQSIWEAVALVLLVVFFFLRSARVALIPLITIPISLIGTFFVIYLLGFSINVLTLLAMVLAVGLVVDDAIVVLENIYRHLEEGMKPYDAARLGIQEIQFSVIGMTLTLVAVYMPIALAQGFVGKLFTEFALTLATAVLLSGFVALVLSPMMCARLLKRPQEQKALSVANGTWQAKIELLWQRLDIFWAKVDVTYRTYLEFFLTHRKTILACAVCLGGLGYVVGVYVLPKELTPLEDQGIIKVNAQGPDGATLSYLDTHLKKIDDLFTEKTEVEKRLTMTQVGDISSERLVLVPREKRKPCNDLLPQIREDLRNTISGVRPYAYCVNRSFGGGADRPFSIVIQTDKPYEKLVEVVRKVRRIVDAHPDIKQSEWDLPQENKIYEMGLKRDVLAFSNISPHTVGTMLDMLISGRKVTTFEKDSKVYPVKVMMESENKLDPAALKTFMVKGRKDNKDFMVPLVDLIEFKEKVANPAISHYARMRSVKIDAALRQGASLKGVYEEVKSAAKQVMPTGFILSPSGDLRRYLKEQNTIVMIFGLAIIFIFLVMAAQFESFRDPFIILLSVPLALVGGILTLWLVKDGTINIYSQIGLITLIGLITKHAILLVDFSNQAIESGTPPLEAVIEAGCKRLRPILMTTFAMVLGVVPLVIGNGAGIEMRRQVGWVILGGMSLGTLFTLFVIPCVYTLFSKRFADAKQ